MKTFMRLGLPVALLALCLLFPMLGDAARPATQSEAAAVRKAVIAQLCPHAPKSLMPCLPGDSGDPAFAARNLRLLLISMSPARDQWGGLGGAGFLTFSSRSMVFVSDNSFAGGKWKFASGSSWETQYACFQFSVEGRAIKMVEIGGTLEVTDATLPVLRLYGNQSGSCPVRKTPRPGVKPGWTVTPPTSECAFHGRDASDSDPASAFMRFNMIGPGASQLCSKVMSALTAGLGGGTLKFQLSPFSDEPQKLQLQCQLSVSSTELGDTIHQKLAPGDYGVEIRSGFTWAEKSNLWEVGFHQCS